MGSRHKSFSDPGTHYEIETSDTPPSVDGFRIGEPTGRVICDCCHAEAHNIDEIPHDNECPQRFTRSDWWVRHLFDD